MVVGWFEVVGGWFEVVVASGLSLRWWWLGLCTKVVVSWSGVVLGCSEVMVGWFEVVVG